MTKYLHFVNVLGPIAFATSKYSNLPYQGWELKPNNNKYIKQFF